MYAFHIGLYLFASAFSTVQYSMVRRGFNTPTVPSSFQSLEREGLLWRVYTPWALEEPLPFGWGFGVGLLFRW